MKTDLTIENISDAALLVTHFDIRKHFQDFFTCQLVFKWFSASPTSAAGLPGKDFSLEWLDNLPAPFLFLGNIDSVSVRAEDDHLLIHCAGSSHFRKKIGQRKVFRAFQTKKQRLKDVIRQILPNDIKFVVYGDAVKAQLAQPYPLSIQYNETDFDFARKLLARFGIPILLDEDRQRFIIGFQNKPDDHIIAYRPGEDSSFKVMNQHFSLEPPEAGLTEPESYPDWRQTKNSRRFHQLLPDILNNIHTASQSRLVFTTLNRIFYPGDLIHIGNTEPVACAAPSDVLRVHTVTYTWSYPDENFSVQVDCISNPTGIFAPDHTLPAATPRLLGTVVKSNGDPEKLGRIMVQLFTDTAAASKSRPACWIPVITPYQGAFDGFCFLPEKGDRVIVECLDLYQGQWAVTGTLRTRDNTITSEQPQSVKVLQTSRKNRITFESSPSPAKAVQEKISIQNGINTLEFTSKGRSSGKVTLLQRDKPVIGITLKGKKKQTVEISALGDLVLRAGGNIKMRSRKGLDIQVAKKGKIKCGRKLKLKGDEIHLN